MARQGDSFYFIFWKRKHYCNPFLTKYLSDRIGDIMRSRKFPFIYTVIEIKIVFFVCLITPDIPFAVNTQ